MKALIGDRPPVGARQLTRTYWRFGLGSVCSAAGTYLVFLAFAHQGSLGEVGVFGVYSAVVAIVVNLFVTVTEQRLIQESVRTGRPSATTLREAHRERLFALVAVAAAAGGVVALVPGDGTRLGAAVGACVLGQGAFGLTLGARVLAQDPRGQLQVQLTSFGCAVLAVAVVVVVRPDLGAAEMLALFALIRLVPAVPALISDIYAPGTGRRPVISLREAMYGGAGRRRTASLLANHSAGAVLSGLDTLLVSAAGPVAVAAYQLAQRPMQALTVLNGAIGQAAFHHGTSELDRTVRVSRLLRIGATLTLLWTACSLPLAVVARQLAPAGVDLPWIVFLGIGLASGFSALAAMTGPLLIVRGRAGDLLAATVLQLLVLLAVGALGVVWLGPFGVVIGLVAARFAAAAVQTQRLHALDSNSTGGGARG